MGNFGHTKKDVAQLVPYKGYWSQTYGNSGKLIEDIVGESVENVQLISKNFPYTKAEIIFFTRHHFAQQLEDMLTRRTSITYAMKDPDEGLIENVASIMAKELGRDTSWIEEQKHKYHQHWLEYHPLFLNPTV